MSDTVGESPDFKYETARLESFQSWPANAKVEAWKMAKAGLRYTGQEEEVHINVQCSACVKIKNLCRGKLWFQKLTGVSSQLTCAWCGCVLGDWQYGDQVCTSSSIYFNAQRNYDNWRIGLICYAFVGACIETVKTERLTAVWQIYWDFLLVRSLSWER